MCFVNMSMFYRNKSSTDYIGPVFSELGQGLLDILNKLRPLGINILTIGNSYYAKRTAYLLQTHKTIKALTYHALGFKKWRTYFLTYFLRLVINTI